MAGRGATGVTGAVVVACADVGVGGAEAVPVVAGTAAGATLETLEAGRDDAEDALVLIRGRLRYGDLLLGSAGRGGRAAGSGGSRGLGSNEAGSSEDEDRGETHLDEVGG